MPLVTTQIVIAVSPKKVRAKFLEFSQIPNYTPNGYIRSIAPAKPKEPSEIETGDVLNCVVGYGSKKVSPTVHENSSSAFSWIITIPGLMVCEHTFRFEEFKTTGSGNEATLFAHEEKFSGILSFIMGGGLLARLAGHAEETKTGFEGFNRDFKTWVES